MLREVVRADQHVGVRVEAPPILAVHEQEVHPGRRRLLLQRVGHAEQDRDPGSSIVRPRHRQGRLRRIERTVGDGPRVPVRQIKHAAALRGPEPRHDVSHRELLAVRRGVDPLLHEHGLGALAKFGDQPIPGRAVRGGAGNARPELDLLADVRHGRAAVESGGAGAHAGRRISAPAGRGEAGGDARREPGEEDRSHDEVGKHRESPGKDGEGVRQTIAPPRGNSPDAALPRPRRPVEYTSLHD